ncbi:hypothetical protein [Amycolatopsis jejuensis]|uniref:hypothetical protein n=1 Tax=Amycolatopsis jejuensis TaxID=330084 RepID=UPI00068FBA5F|nr:hypothetical protein [Amycolatopsis jejuensis]
MPPPLTYVIVSRQPASINAAKGRPLDQEVAVWLYQDAAWTALTPSLDLEPAARQTAARLMREELVTLLVPLRERATPPEWSAPATRRGFVLVCGGRWEPLASLIDQFPLLYVSSANSTGNDPAATAVAAKAMFGPEVPVVDGDALRDPDLDYRATTMLRMAPDGKVDLVRHGAQDRGEQSYLETLTRLGVTSWA